MYSIIMTCPRTRLKNKPALYAILVFSIACLLTAIPVRAEVGEGLYLTFAGTINTYEDMNLTDPVATLPDFLKEWGSYLKTDAGIGFNHSIGYNFGSEFSLEVEFSSQGGEFDRGCSHASCIEALSEKMDGDIETKSLLVNGIYFFDYSETISPYIGWGVGTAFHEATLDGYDDGAQTTFAYQFKTGIDLKLSHHINLFTGYRFFTTDDPDFGFFKGEVTSHSLEAGIRYYF